MPEILLAGCTEQPLSAYLRALGVFRLVGEQKDAGVRACWKNGVLALVSHSLTREGLVSGQDVRIVMPGGELAVSITDEAGQIRDIFLTGPTCLVCEGELSEEICREANA